MQNAWEREKHSDGKEVAGEVKGVLKDLVYWSRNVLGDLGKRMHRTKKELEAVRRKNICEDHVRREQLLRFKLSRLEEQLETY